MADLWAVVGIIAFFAAMVAFAVSLEHL